MAMTRHRNPLLSMIGYAFVKLYYDLLLTSPERLTAFYYDNGSTLIRPVATAGAIDFITTHEAMREEFRSMDVVAAHMGQSRVELVLGGEIACAFMLEQCAARDVSVLHKVSCSDFGTYTNSFQVGLGPMQL
ncbi:unnamed protein product [Urochloa humidicola]